MFRPAFESVHIAFRGGTVYPAVLVGQTTLEDDGLIVLESSVLLEEYVVAVVRVVVCSATKEVVSVANRDFRGESVGIAVTLILILVGVAVDDIVE